MDNLIDQLISMATTFGLAVGIFLGISLISAFLFKLANTDYSDQEGWKNFRKSFLGWALFAIIIIAVIVGFIFIVSLT